MMNDCKESQGVEGTNSSEALTVTSSMEVAANKGQNLVSEK